MRRWTDLPDVQRPTPASSPPEFRSRRLRPRRPARPGSGPSASGACSRRPRRCCPVGHRAARQPGSPASRTPQRRSLQTLDAAQAPGRQRLARLRFPHRPFNPTRARTGCRRQPQPERSGDPQQRPQAPSFTRHPAASPGQRSRCSSKPDAAQCRARPTGSPTGTPTTISSRLQLGAPARRDGPTPPESQTCQAAAASSEGLILRRRHVADASCLLAATGKAQPIRFRHPLSRRHPKAWAPPRRLRVRHRQIRILGALLRVPRLRATPTAPPRSKRWPRHPPRPNRPPLPPLDPARRRAMRWIRKRRHAKAGADRKGKLSHAPSGPPIPILVPESARMGGKR